MDTAFESNNDDDDDDVGDFDKNEPSQEPPSLHRYHQHHHHQHHHSQSNAKNAHHPRPKPHTPTPPPKTRYQPYSSAESGSFFICVQDDEHVVRRIPVSEELHTVIKNLTRENERLHTRVDRLDAQLSQTEKQMDNEAEAAERLIQSELQGKIAALHRLDCVSDEMVSLSGECSRLQSLLGEINRNKSWLQQKILEKDVEAISYFYFLSTFLFCVNNYLFFYIYRNPLMSTWIEFQHSKRRLIF
jgi:hypothetical protein